MSRAPRAKQQNEINDYIASWHATMQLLREGKSFSGRERNCAFLNLGNRQFATTSWNMGVDFPDDGRAIASVDWDHDGDLDLWFLNRTGPRLRFMRNQANDRIESPDNFVALTLRGTNSNRDAIGARVELQLKDRSTSESTWLIETVRAGDGYLSQASKTVHFGIGPDSTIESVSVRWPDGTTQSFDGIDAGHRYLLTEGANQAVATDEQRRTISLPAQDQATSPATNSVRALFANAVPLPIFEMHSLESGERELVTAQGKPLLILFWASSCPICVDELSQFTAHNKSVAGAIDVVAINLDALAISPVTSNATDVIRQTRFPFRSGSATDVLMDKIRVLQRIVLNRPLASAVPFMLLADANNQLVAMYQGAQPIQTIIDDAASSSNSIVARRSRSVPFPGTWTTPPDILLLRPVASVFQEAGHDDDYLRYLQLDRQRLSQLLTSSNSDKVRQQLAVRVANDSFDVGLSLLESGQAAESIDYFREGLELVPSSAKGHFHFGRALESVGKSESAFAEYSSTVSLDPKFARARFRLGMMAASKNRFDEAIEHFRSIVNDHPDHVDAWANLGVILARTRKNEEAIAALKRATELDDSRVQSWLALGGQLASRGEFSKAADCFARVTELQPNLAQGFAALGQAFAQMKQDENAVTALRRAISLNPRDAGSQLSLASIQAASSIESIRDGENALAIATQLAAMTQNQDPRVLDVLAAAYAETGDFDQATKIANDALALIPNEHPLRKQVESRLALYRSKKTVAGGANRTD
ncbi:MAG: ASPIC/UnbV domain-containing protein [Planctomycetales bacterium]|nr:ASPIC/UnbV domain-containing protein [Planctomycetales bacterium]